MIARLTLTALTLISATLAGQAMAQATPPIFASEACKSGCVYHNARLEESTIYSGAIPKSYRICTASLFEAKANVDGKTVTIKGDGFCSDVNGLKIVLTDKEARVGRIPD